MSQVVAVVGPTASGKTETAVDVASRIGAEIISVDSMQVYRGMDIGTAKPSILERRGVPHHMIDVAEPEEDFSVARFRRMARPILEGAGSPMVIVGGSGLHFRALVDPMSFAPTDPNVRHALEESEPEQLVAALVGRDPEAGRHVDLANPRRVVRALEIIRLTGETPSERARSAEADDLRRYVPQIPFTGIGIDPGDHLEDRIDVRLAEMRRGGLLEEVRRIRTRLGRTSGSAVGYRELVSHLDGVLGLDEAWEEIRSNTRKLARRQRTWFQRDPRIRWIPWLEDSAVRAERVMEAMA